MRASVPCQTSALSSCMECSYGKTIWSIAHVLWDCNRSLGDRLRHDAAVEEINAPFGPGDMPWIVGRQADGRAVGMQLLQHLHDRLTRFRVQISGRLVGE